MLREKMLGMILCAVLLAGCDVNINLPKAESKAREAAALAEPVGEAASDILEGIEDVTGRDIISPKTAEKGEQISNTVTSTTDKIRDGLDIVAPFVPEKQKPWLSLFDGVLLAISAVSASLAKLFHRQKKKGESVVATVIKAVDDEPGIGKKIVNVAEKDGTHDDVRAAYLGLKKDGHVG